MRKLILAALAAVVVSLALFAPGTANDASAGSNGQQLEVYQCYASSIKIVGKNQNNVTATYTITNSSKTGCSNHPISGWWWKGSVTLTSAFANGTKWTKTVNVPVSQASNWYKVNMTPPPVINSITCTNGGSLGRTVTCTSSILGSVGSYSWSASGSDSRSGATSSTFKATYNQGKTVTSTISLKACNSVGCTTKSKSVTICECVAYVQKVFGLPNGSFGCASNMGSYLQQNGFRKVSSPSVNAIAVFKWPDNTCGHAGLVRSWTTTSLVIRGANQYKGPYTTLSGCSNVSDASYSRSAVIGYYVR